MNDDPSAREGHSRRLPLAAILLATALLLWGLGSAWRLGIVAFLREQGATPGGPVVVVRQILLWLSAAAAIVGAPIFLARRGFGRGLLILTCCADILVEVLPLIRHIFEADWLAPVNPLSMAGPLSGAVTGMAIPAFLLAYLGSRAMATRMRAYDSGEMVPDIADVRKAPGLPVAAWVLGLCILTGGAVTILEAARSVCRVGGGGMADIIGPVGFSTLLSAGAIGLLARRDWGRRVLATAKRVFLIIGAVMFASSFVTISEGELQWQVLHPSRLTSLGDLVCEAGTIAYLLSDEIVAATRRCRPRRPPDESGDAEAARLQ